MLRHSVLWLLRDTTGPEQRTRMLQGLAFLRMECPTVRAGDYGDDLFGGTARLREIPPWNRQPRWRTGPDLPPSNFDLALHLDFDDWAGHDAYGSHPVHNAQSAFNESVAWDELTARVDWEFDGDPPTVRGLVRHVGMFVWDGATETARRRALDSVQRLEGEPGVTRVATAPNIGTLSTDYDWIMDIHLADRGAAERLLGGEAYAAAMGDVGAATKVEWTARLSHVMRGP